ncbi:M23/M56 family metallopeptidase [Gilvimarinus algae]|uniref:M23/M56 family metallopeptidase n=1 Tax=Gilvimarinus algae TaxID=3058037 RepID=A0ABT8TFJ6_9GAMM|nr:M23/M56 family metallopeptidase [Gilvimarinus sp. SDUM040014]MDO3382163.1 M23/M56 family metallopeptidase [Gilvimarinus sp. SDUM040014]
MTALAEFLAGLTSDLLLQWQVASIWFVILCPVAFVAQRRLPGLAAGLCWLVLLRALVPVGVVPALWWSWHDTTAHWSVLPPLSPIAAPLGFDGPGASVQQWLAIAMGLFLFLAWLLASIFLFWQYQRERYRLHRVAYKSLDCSSVWVAETFAQLKTKLNVKSARLVVTDTADYAYTIGSYRPVVVLPASMLNIQAGLVEAVLAHELTHVKRRDDFKLLCLNYMRIACCYFPPLWFCARLIVQCNEKQCDRAVIWQSGIDRKRYARSLFAAAQLQALGSSAVMQLSPGQLLAERVQSIYEPGALTVRSVWPVRVFIATVLFTLFPAHAGMAGSSSVVGLISPVPNARLSSGYGERSNPFVAGEVGFHHGVDLAAPQGQPVLSAGTGRVIEVGYNDARGHYVVVGHAAGLAASYSHLLDTAVELGDTVLQGQRLGAVGESGRATGPHLHFELVQAGQAVNPADYINFGRSDG